MHSHPQPAHTVRCPVCGLVFFGCSTPPEHVPAHGARTNVAGVVARCSGGSASVPMGPGPALVYPAIRHL